MYWDAHIDQSIDRLIDEAFVNVVVLVAMLFGCELE